MIFNYIRRYLFSICCTCNSRTIANTCNHRLNFEIETEDGLTAIDHTGDRGTEDGLTAQGAEEQEMDSQSQP